MLPEVAGYSPMQRSIKLSQDAWILSAPKMYVMSVLRTKIIATSASSTAGPTVGSPFAATNLMSALMIVTPSEALILNSLAIKRRKHSALAALFLSYQRRTQWSIRVTQARLLVTQTYLHFLITAWIRATQAHFCSQIFFLTFLGLFIDSEVRRKPSHLVHQAVNLPIKAYLAINSHLPIFRP